MGVERTSTAKITRPAPTGCYPRKRIFHAPDRGQKRSILRISGPPGSGKMRRPATGIVVASALLALLCLFPAPAHPTNGLNMIGFGAESVALGGADLAVARDTSAMNNNPAGKASIPGSALDGYGAIAYPLTVAHRDRLGNDVEVSNRRIVIGGGGYTRRLGDGPVMVGIGFFAQGGRETSTRTSPLPLARRMKCPSSSGSGR